MALWDHIYSAPHFKAREPWLDEWASRGFRINGGLYQEIVAGVESAPDSILTFGSETRPSQATLAEILEDGSRVAAGLHALGLSAGDVMVFQMPNWRESMAAMIAALRLGVVLVPVVHIYGPAELGYILRATQARALMLPARWRKIDYAERVAALGETPHLEHVIVLGDEPMPRPTVRWDELLRASAEAPIHAPRPDDLAMMNFTSGTTAEPKGVLHSHASLAAEARLMVANPGGGVDDRAGRLGTSIGPGGHIAAILGALRALLAGEDCVYMDQFDGPLLMALLERHPIRRFGGAPFAVTHLLDHAPAEKINQITELSSGGAGVPPALVYRAEALGIPMVRTYGSTELPTATTCHPNDPIEKRANTDGRLLPGVQLRIVDDDGNVLSAGHAGEIVGIAPELCLGYLDPALNLEAFTTDGWFRTGDIGVMDEDGFLTIVDRKKDIIIRGGENISSKEVEDVLARHPAILEAAVVPWPDRAYGERVGAFVRVKPGASVDIASIAQHFMAAGVARQKTPERLWVVEDFPRTPLGKILKRDLRRQIPPEGTVG